MKQLASAMRQFAVALSLAAVGCLRQDSGDVKLAGGSMGVSAPATSAEAAVTILCPGVIEDSVATIVPRVSIEMRAPVAGVTRALVAQGASVAGGTALYEVAIDHDEENERELERTELMRLEAAYGAATAEVTRLKSQSNRSEALYREGLISAETHESVSADLSRAEFQQRAAEAAVAHHRAQGDKRKAGNSRLVRAPFAGVVGEVLVSSGAQVFPGDRLATLRTKEVLVKFAVAALYLLPTRGVQVSDKIGLCFPDSGKQVGRAIVTQMDNVTNQVTGLSHGVAKPEVGANVEALVGRSLLVQIERQ